MQRPRKNGGGKGPRTAHKERLKLCKDLMRKLQAIAHHKRQGLKSVDIQREERPAIQRVVA